MADPTDISWTSNEVVLPISVATGTAYFLTVGLTTLPPTTYLLMSTFSVDEVVLTDGDSYTNTWAVGAEIATGTAYFLTVGLTTPPPTTYLLMSTFSVDEVVLTDGDSYTNTWAVGSEIA